MKSFVYIITNTLNGKVYIGKSNDPKARFAYHIRTSYHKSSPLSRAILKYGEESFDFKVLEEFQSEEEAYNYEKLLIESLVAGGQVLYNLAAGGRGILMTPALRERMKAVWGDSNRLAKIAEASKRNWAIESFRTNISIKVKMRFKDSDFKSRHSEATRLGMTLESRKKISETHKGRTQSPEERASRSAGCLRYWDDEKRLEWSQKLSCENNPNAKLCKVDVIRCRVLSTLFIITSSQIARILVLPYKAVKNAIDYGTWKSLLIKDENGNLTDEALSEYRKLLREFVNISPSAKTTQRVKLTPFGSSIPEVLAAYDSWRELAK